MFYRLLSSQVKKYNYYRETIQPLKRELSEDLNNKRSNINEKLTKNEIDDVNSFWGVYSNQFDRDWFSLYKSLGHDYNLCHYVPDDFYYRYVDSFFANRNACRVIDNKNLYDLLFHDVPQPSTIARKIGGVYLTHDYSRISEEEFVELCRTENSVVLKKSIDSSGGKGILFFDAELDSIEKLLNWIKDKNDLIVQGVIIQHDELNRIHPESINSIRIITLVLGEVYILSSVLRMGRGGAKVDNASSGGIVCGIEPSGWLKSEAFDVKANRYDKHPSGVRFESIMVPGFNSCQEICKRLAFRLIQYTKLVSWDLAIDKNGTPILLEANLCRGQLDFHQMCNGPLFGDMTKSVMDVVFSKKYK